MAKKTIEETYQKLTPREHVLHRNDMYVGSTELITQEMWVLEDPNEIENFKLIKKTITYSPAFLKIFDEILTNASDHYWRNVGVKYIKIKFEDDHFEIENDGTGIPVEIHKGEKLYVPELIFGHLLAGSNFDDTEERFGAGRNGIGSCLTNIFSKKFIIETADGKKKYKQTFKDNMDENKKSEPTITSSTENYTVIKYWPDLEKFNMENVDNDTLSLILKRIIDVAAYCPKIKVSWNGKTVPIKTIRDWMAMHLPENTELFYEAINKNWEIGVAKTTGMSFEQISVVNGISTYRGGTHVNEISRELSKVVYEELARKNKKMKFSWVDVKNNIFLFLICKIPNPTFDTQTKEALTNVIKDSLPTITFSDLFIKKIIKSEICQSILDWLAAKEAQMLMKESKKLANVKVQKLIDAASKQREDCILYIYEGDSAKSAFRKFRGAKSDVKGESILGAFPLRGKFINVSEMSAKDIIENEEAKNLMSSLGLHLAGKAEELRYGKIYISTDSDVDGHAISALLLNFFFKFWPELFEEERIYKVYTPLLVVKKVIKEKNEIPLYFYTDEEYQDWAKKIDLKKYNIEYKKGLAALGDIEYKEMFTSPKAVKITKDQIAKESLEVWFGKNSELRKEKLMKI
jgi:DNA topoisomerase-2